ncbi:hypothetical protein B0H11DRAFT_1954730 [Mycena galericulata]|nr:hypothetical protein B0H11DRAFT_1954730 [Mycena galericulata]
MRVSLIHLFESRALTNETTGHTGDAAFIALLCALTTFYMFHLTLQRDTDPVSRLNKQFVIVNFLLFCWVLSGASHPFFFWISLSYGTLSSRTHAPT